MTDQQVAEKLGLSRRTVIRKRQEALEALRPMVEEDDPRPKPEFELPRKKQELQTNESHFEPSLVTARLCMCGETKSHLGHKHKPCSWVEVKYGYSDRARKVREFNEKH